MTTDSLVFEYLQSGGSIATGIVLFLLYDVRKRLDHMTNRIDGLYKNNRKKKKN